MKSKSQSTNVPIVATVTTQAAEGAATKPSATPRCDHSATPTKAMAYPLKFRGTLTQLDSQGNCEFRAQASGEPAQEVLAKQGSGKLYRTTGKRNPQMVAHLSVPADTADPVASMTRQFNALTKEMQTRKRPEVKGETLLNEEGARLQLMPKENKLIASLELSLDDQNITYTLTQLFTKIHLCLLTNREKVLNARK